MIREGKRPLAATVVAVLVAALLVACGSSDSGDSSGTTASDSTTAVQNKGGEKQGDSQGQSSHSRSESQSANKGSSQDQQSSDDKNSSPKNVATPLQVSGGGSAQYRTKGGDNSIQEFGEEEESELQEVAEIVHNFFVARAEEDWETACSYLSKSNIEQLERLGAQSPQFKNAGCGKILAAFTRPLPASVEREITKVDAGSFRREGEQGFLIYHGAGDEVYAMPLFNENGAWKVTSLSGTSLT